LSSKKTPPKIKWLKSFTSEDWLQMAIANPLEVLLDHAHCERKAAGFALQMIFRYVSEPGLSEVLSPIAREELEHFELVLRILKSRGLALKPLPAPPYASLLSKQVRKTEPERMLDSFLVACLIEARSHERMSLLSMHMPDKELRDLYKNLLNSEARHFGCYMTLAETRYEPTKIALRLEYLSEFESSILTKLHPFARMHS
tara:strand:+ start:439 stop:1041 length:603 start_codon:yes stop_codon:yes gene_type:complete